MRKCCQHVCVVFQQTAEASVRTIAKLTGIPRRSAHRDNVGLVTRNQYIPNHTSGSAKKAISGWACRVCARVSGFGLMRGAESLSVFFTRLHLQTHIGVSPSAIRTIRRDMDTQILRDQPEQEIEHRQQAKCSLEVCVGADDTFFHERLLVFMVLSSGDLFVEDAAQDRT